ncbi:MAG: tetratricopeptide repeat protein [Candidatus Helarchaeota archaeon]
MVEEEKEELGDAIKEFNRGLDSHIEGNLKQALKHFQAALPTFQEFGVADMIAGTLHEMGMVYQEQGDYDKALEYYQQSLQLSEHINYLPGCAKTLYQIATLYEAKGDHITANDYYQRAEAYKIRKPPGLNFIIFAFIATGLWGLIVGLIGVLGDPTSFEPLFISPELWARLASGIQSISPLALGLGIIALPAGIGLYKLKGWGWVLGIFTSLLTVIVISGIIFYWYLSKENIQEMYDVKF